jgi:hypothetical protein
VVLRVDEAGFIGARQARHLLQTVQVLKAQEVMGPGQAILSAGAGAGKGRGADVPHRKEIRRQRHPERWQIIWLLIRLAPVPSGR